MSYDDGMAAINLDMPGRVPRTEYSAAETHWELVKSVTGVEVSPDSDEDLKIRVSSEFRKAWNYDFVWSILIYNEVFGDIYTKMGHAEFASQGSDFDSETRCLFSDSEDVLNFDPWQVYGPVDKKAVTKQFEAHYKKNCKKNHDAVNMTGIYITCVSGLIEIFGWDMLLMSLGTDAERFGELTNRYASWMQQYFDALAEADVPVVMVHDDIVWTSGAFISPDWYRKYVFPNYDKYFAALIESGKKIMYTCDGNYTEFIDDVVDTGVHGFVLEPSTDMRYIAEKYGKTHSFIGNADTRILLNGSRQDIRAEVERCMDIGKKCPGFFMAVGNHIPSNTPVENVIYYNQMYEEMSKR